MENNPIEVPPFGDEQAQCSSDCQQDDEAKGHTDSQTARPDTDSRTTLNAEGEADTLREAAEAPAAKKKKRRSKKSRGKKKGTGFEEYVADGPITVAEYEENKNRYDRRLETAIQRFQAKRSMNDNRRNVFTKYMSFGGVDVGPKMFEGNDPRDLMDKDSEDILNATAQATVPENRVGWDVGFETVAKGFLHVYTHLSSVLPQYIGLETEELVDMATGTIRNFLNYILLHDVCPEYSEDILAARLICDTAKVELWKSQQVNCWAPGNFNMACSTLFGGYFYGFYNGGQKWSNEVGAEGMPDSIAHKVVKFAIAGAGSYDQAVRFRNLANDSELKATCVDENGFEVIAIAPADSDVRDFYKQYAPDLQPVGKLRAKPWRNPGLPEEDLPPGKVCGAHAVPSSSAAREYEFFVDESLLKFCFVGMKIDTSIWELNCGLHYFDNVMAVYCSFYTILLNESMIGWKEPRDLRGDEVVWVNSGVAKEVGDKADSPERGARDS
ncbi:hypothetical protein AJ78_04433 [Emergomyces pasteurianus Ep9510]|uniref:Argonaute complex, subunit Arb1 n=1 Tax=Emergomyces pasteurianus Ep9510 TaxID=1447872 RepID=A0A1J9QH84_9EURO|nr:hypothetical protein AJ78_04433 [Emergomyces pasteurianus Ep9510]